MKIHISHNKICYNRILPLYRTLQKNHEVTISDSIEIVPSADVWIVDWFCLTMEQMITRINAHEAQFLQFKGKLLPISMDDGCTTFTIGLKESILHRIDGWFTGIIWDNNPAVWKLHDDCLKDKFILIPRFVIDYKEVQFPPERTNQIVFYGATTGALKLNGKNPRIEALKIIESNPFLKSHFKGGVTYNYILDDAPETPEYRATYQHLVVPHYPQQQWLKLLSESTLCPNMEGNGLFSYRPLETLRAKTAMLSPPFFKDPGVWLFAEKLRDCFWLYRRDLSDFASVCEQALLDQDKSIELAEKGYDVYKTYLETPPDNTFNDKTVQQMVDKFEKLTGLLL